MEYSKKQRLTKNLTALRQYEKTMPTGIQTKSKDDRVSEKRKTQINGIKQRTMEEVELFPLAMAYVPWQSIHTVYDAHKALQIGTIFPELDLPFCGMQEGRK